MMEHVFAQLQLKVSTLNTRWTPWWGINLILSFFFILFNSIFLFLCVVTAGINVVCYFIYMATEAPSQGDLFYVIYF